MTLYDLDFLCAAPLSGCIADQNRNFVVGGKSGKMSLTDSSPLEMARSASIASRSLAVLPTKARNNALTAIHQALANARKSILAANAKDLDLATKAAENGEPSQSVLKRLDLGRKGKFEDMLQGILDVRDLNDPCKSLVQTR